MRFLSLVLCASLTGCASATFPVDNLDEFSYPGPDRTSATVSAIYGNSPDGRLFFYNVTVDGKKVASLKNEQHVTFSVPAGSHTIGFKCPPLLKCPSVALAGTFESGKHYYLFGTYGIALDVPIANGYGMKVTLNPISESRANEYLAKYKPGKLAP